MTPEVPCRLLIGPLYNLGVIGRYAQSENIRLFMPRSSHTEAYPYDLVYEQYEIQCFNDILKGLTPDWEPDLVIWWDPVYQSVPPGVEDCPYPTALIPGDWNLAYLSIVQLAQAFDMVFADGRLGPILRKEGVENVFPWIGFAYDAEKIYPDTETEYLYDVSFIGNLNPAIHPVRSRYLDRLLTLKDEYRLHLACNVWGEDYRKVMAQSRMVFNYTICQVLNMRSFEAPAAGALLLIEDSNIEVRQVFDPEACVLYNQDNLLDQVRYFLEHEDQREHMARRGQKIAQTYSYERHFERLLQQIAQIDLTQFPQSRPVSLQSQDKRRMRALNICSASSARGATQVGIELQNIRNGFVQQGFGTDDVWRLNALMAMVFPYLDEEEKLHFFYEISLPELARWFEFALRLAPKHPVLLYHYAFISEYQGEYERALKYYSHAFEEMTYGERSILLECREFIVPFNKAGRGTQTLAFEWERMSYESVEQDKDLLSAYYLLMSAQIWQCLGRVLTKLQSYDKALTAYESAYANAAIPEFLLRQAEIYRQQGRHPEALDSFERALDVQPFYIQYLPTLLNTAILIEHAERIESWISKYTEVFSDQLSGVSALLQMIAVGEQRASPKTAQEWLSILNQVAFDAAFFQNLTQILQAFQNVVALSDLQALRIPLEMRWDLKEEPSPQLHIHHGMIWSRHAEISIGRSSQHSWQRIYGKLDHSPKALDLQAFPYLYPQGQAQYSHEVAEIMADYTVAYLLILDGASRKQIRELLTSLCTQALREESVLIVWSPGEWSFVDFETILPEEISFEMAWLDTELSRLEQLYLLERVSGVLAAPRELGHYLGCWASRLERPLTWLHEPEAELSQLQDFEAPVFHSWIEFWAYTFPEDRTHTAPIKRELLEQSWIQGLWGLKLQQQLRDN